MFNIKILFKYKLIYFLVAFIWSCNSKTTEVTTEINERKVVEMVTNHGTIILELYNETPLHRDNFIKLINEKAYDSLLFHRVIKNFMVQAGDPDSRNATPETVLGEGDLNYTIEAEIRPNLFHKKGALAAAREETLGRVSSAMQFYIVQGRVFHDSLIDKNEKRINEMLAKHYTINDSLYQPLWNILKEATEKKDRELYMRLNDSINTIAETYSNFKNYKIPEIHREAYRTIGGTPHLDQSYTVFGQVIDGLEVIDAIGKTKTNDLSRPLSDVKILSVRLRNK